MKPKKIKQINFNGFDVEVYLESYTTNNRPALTLIDIEDGKMFGVATINVPNENIEKDCMVIGDYENAGIMDTLIAEKIISKPLSVVQTGCVASPVCRLLVSVS